RMVASTVATALVVTRSNQGQRKGRRPRGRRPFLHKEAEMTSPFELAPQQEHKLAAVMNAACAVFPQQYSPDGCIAAARILVDVFDRLHVRCRPLAVVVDVFNPNMVQRCAAEGGRLPETTEEYQRWIEESSCWWLTLGLPADPEPGKWPGHVGVVVWETI